MYKLFYWLFFAKIKFASCVPEVNRSGFVKGKKLFQLEKIGQLPAVLNENSGLVALSGKNTLYAHNDGGGKAALYEIDQKGNLLNTLALDQSKNIDWEDISADGAGHIYIGDFGNNSNSRKDLNIIKYGNGQCSQIHFNLADQKAFPPARKDRNFDFEAFFWAKDSLFLFSKNRGDHLTKMYKMPDKPGSYTLSPADELYLKASVTAACINPSNSQFALLSYGKIFLFGISESGTINFDKPLFCIKAALKQSEAMSYITDNELIISNEQGQLYRLTLNNVKGL